MDLLQIDRTPLSNQHAFSVDPIPIPIGEALVHEQVFRRARPQSLLGINLPKRTALNGSQLEGNGAKRHINADPV